MQAKIQEPKAGSCLKFIWSGPEPHNPGATSGYSSAYCNFLQVSPKFKMSFAGLLTHLIPLLTFESLTYVMWLPMLLISSERPVKMKKKKKIEIVCPKC